MLSNAITSPVYIQYKDEGGEEKDELKQEYRIQESECREKDKLKKEDRKWFTTSNLWYSHVKLTFHKNYFINARTSENGKRRKCDSIGIIA
jgi:hypothetical protein